MNAVGVVTRGLAVTPPDARALQLQQSDAAPLETGMKSGGQTVGGTFPVI